MRIAICLAAAALSLAACDRSPQNADGATAKGDPGVAAATGATPAGPTADTGRDTGTANVPVGGAGQVTSQDGATDAGAATSPKSE